MNLALIFGGLMLILGLVIWDDINVRSDYKSFIQTQTVLAKSQKAENERLTKSLIEQRELLETENVKAVANRKQFDTELDRLRAQRARTDRKVQTPVTAGVCADDSGNQRLAGAVSQYREAVDRFRDAVGDYRESVLGVFKEAQRQTDTLMICQSWINSIQRAQ